MTPTAFGDAELRAALHRKKFNKLKSQQKVLVVDELGLAHARSRIDVAVINGCVHGYEIKSEKDTLERFSAQLEIYRRSLGRLTIVCAPRHLAHIEAGTPSWCGIIEAERGPRGAVRFYSRRRAESNPELDSYMLAHLLWHSEAVTLLTELDFDPSELRKSRRELYAMIADRMTPRQITESIQRFMIRRSDWRDLPGQP